ncbi:MAG: SPOR domain-containing protein [Bacteroidota bacterium]|nr:SPOR domain-containing protein [Bacteroidota bacterium]
MIPFIYFCKVEKFCQHIEKLLAQHDYVVVPNLGGFVVQQQSAKLLPDYITPPLSTIGFNPLMHHADGLLAIEIARSQQISYRLAMEYIDKEVDRLKLELNSNKNVSFGNLGSFYQDEPGNLLFSPASDVEFLPQNFELANIHISQRNNLLKDEKPKIILTLPSTRIFKYASAAMLIFGLFFISPRINDMRQANNANLATTVFYNPSQDFASTNTSEKTESSLETPTSTEDENFHVIVASLPTEESAEKFCDELVATDFPDAHVLPSSKTYRIAIQSFSDREKAILFMENLRKSDSRFDTAWVLCK